MLLQVHIITCTYSECPSALCVCWVRRRFIKFGCLEVFNFTFTNCKSKRAAISRLTRSYYSKSKWREKKLSLSLMSIQKFLKILSAVTFQTINYYFDYIKVYIFTSQIGQSIAKNHLFWSNNFVIHKLGWLALIYHNEVRFTDGWWDGESLYTDHLCPKCLEPYNLQSE